jgi:hypothetical protein
MLTWEVLHSRETPCLRCRSTKPIAGPLSAGARQQVAEALHAGRAIDVFRIIREDTACGLVEAKGTYQHLVQKTGQCHWCGKPLPAHELVDCPACNALNIHLG